MAGYVPVPLGPCDYIELLPATWRVINSYGIKIARRTVAKYREMLCILASSKRKKLF